MTRLITSMLLGACLAVPLAHAQETEAVIKRWAIKASLAIGPPSFNAQGLKGYFEENGFDDVYDFFLGDIEYPRVDGGYKFSGSLQAARRVHSQFDTGVFVHRAVDTEVSGYSNSAGRATLRQRMWAVAPIVSWRPWAGPAVAGTQPWWTNVVIGVGPSYVRGQTTSYEGWGSASDQALTPAESEFSRMGATVSFAYGETIGPFRLGAEGRYLYVGKQKIGPFESEGLTLARRSIRLDQLTVGLFVTLEL